MLLHLGLEAKWVCPCLVAVHEILALERRRNCTEGVWEGYHLAPCLLPMTTYVEAGLFKMESWPTLLVNESIRYIQCVPDLTGNLATPHPNMLVSNRGRKASITKGLRGKPPLPPCGVVLSTSALGKYGNAVLAGSHCCSTRQSKKAYPATIDVHLCSFQTKTRLSGATGEPSREPQLKQGGTEPTSVVPF